MKRSTLDSTFEALAVAFLAQHPDLRHEWRDVASWISGDRRDLVCAPGQPNEVFASLKETQIAVGPAVGDHEDFEDFGRGLADEDVAREAFARLVEILTETRHITLSSRDDG